jgi:hypothetical protein
MEQEKTSLEKIENAYVKNSVYDALDSIEFYVSDCYEHLGDMREVKDFNDAVCAIVFAHRHIREAELEVVAVKKQYGCTEGRKNKDEETVSSEIPTDARV